MPTANASTVKESRLVNGINKYFFYGWVVVAVGFLAQMLTSVSTQGLGTYVVPLEQQFGWSAAATAAGRSVQQVNTFFGPANGWLVDKVGSRRVMTVGVFLFSFGFFLFSRIDSLFTYYVACFIMELANQLVGLLVVSVAINSWFRRKRSTAMGIAVMGLAAAGATVLPGLVFVQGAYGWRTSALATSIGMLIIGVPIIVFMRNSPEPYGLLPDGDKPDTVVTGDTGPRRGSGVIEFTFSEAMHTRTFWMVTAGLTLAQMAQGSVSVWQFPYIQGIMSRDVAAYILTVINIFNLGGRLVGGVLGDRMPKNRLMGFNLLGSFVAMLLLAFAHSVPLLLVFGAIYGFSWGVRTPVTQAMQGDYYGRLAFGKILGLTQTVAAPFAIAGPIAVGAMVDIQHTFFPSFLILSSLTLIAAITFFVSTRPKPPARYNLPA